MKYLMRVFDTCGEVQSIHIDSDSPASAAATARSRGLRVVSIRLTAGGKRGPGRWMTLQVTKFDVELFARELAALLDAGVGVIDALRTLGSNERRDASAKSTGSC